MNRYSNGTMPVSTHKTKAKDWQLEILMEKLRSKSAQYKTLPEISKNVRMSLLEKRYASDSVEKSQHQKCLDSLQHSIKVKSLQSMVERLECLARQLGLKFIGESSHIFISSDMFYLDIVLEPTGQVKDVKIHHECIKEMQTCHDLVACLTRGDFADFTAQLEGFVSIYQLNAEKEVKAKAFPALASLESDLFTLAQLQLFMKEPFNLLHKSPVGLLEKRRDGHPMKLTYFVSPYDLLNVESADLDPISVDGIIGKGLGYSVTVCMEGAAAHKLQTSSLITVNVSMSGKQTPSYVPLTAENSATIPACFVLKLNKPMPICMSLVRQIQQIHPWTEVDDLQVGPILSLIVTHSSEGKLDSANSRGLFVTLPDQSHCYFMTENKSMEGVLVNRIPFTHPAHVSSILMILREQALFNTIISSCVRPNSRQDFENMTMFEISALSSKHISISLEHPVEESMATAEIDLSDISSLICRIHNPGSPPSATITDQASELGSKILNRSFSIPITLRSVIKLWEKQSTMRRNHYNGHENFSLPLGSGDPGGHSKSNSGQTEFGGLDNTTAGNNNNNNKIKQEQLGNNNGMNHGLFLNEENFPNFPPSDGVLSNIELTNILCGTLEKTGVKRMRKATAAGKRKVGGTDEESQSSCDSTSRSTPLGFQSDPSDQCDDLGDVEEILAGKPKFLTDLVDKAIIPPSVSITPINPAGNFNAVSIENRIKSGIEIIPIANTTGSITITPIGVAKMLEEKKYSKTKSRDDKLRLEKKRKRKRDESPMGPPEKVPMPKVEGSVKVVGVGGVKVVESPPDSPSKGGRSSSGKLSPNLVRASLKSIEVKVHHGHSPKHSPGSVAVSPKHIVGISSPKHHGTSPKHPSTSGSGKPSMSTLKSAANSPSSKTTASTNDSTKSKSSSKESSSSSSRDKEKKLNVFNVNSKAKSSSSTIKIKPLDLNTTLEVISDGLPSPSGITDCSKINLALANQVRNRKGSLSAIVDKLKVNAQHCDIATDLTTTMIKSSNRERLPSQSAGTSANAPKSASGTPKLPGEKNSEYMVKPSSDGMKITINKTRTKEKSGSSGAIKSNSSGTGSPKTHTGLKPGVNSGPASKKPQQKLNSALIKNSTINKSGSTQSNKLSGISKLVSSKFPPKIGGKDRVKGSSKSNPEKSIFSVKDNRKASPNSKEDDGFKLQSKLEPFASSLMMEGVMKQFDKNFQIPKLSARTAIDDKKGKVVDGSGNNVRSEAKMFDLIAKNDLKYPMATNKVFENSIELKLRNNANSVVLKKDDDVFEEAKKKEVPQSLASVQGQAKEEVYKLDPISASTKTFPNTTSVSLLPSSTSSAIVPSADQPLSLSTKSIDLTSKFVTPAIPMPTAAASSKIEEKKEKKSDDLLATLLDFSSKSDTNNKVVSATQFPQSPSVSVHIVKSPAPSPLLINPSPHSASPCITDDELMDEALIGLGK